MAFLKRNGMTILLFILAVLILVSLQFVYKLSKNTPKGYHFAWEGFWKSTNFRDAGVSINKCIGKDIFFTGKLLRSNKYFSGWPCRKIGDPEKILTLNFEPNAPKKYFCLKDKNEILSGFHPETDIEIQDVELIDTWKNSKSRQAICGAFDYAIKQLEADSRLLVHCSAGRDRTGAIIALLMAVAAEEANILNIDIINGIECDYRLTKSLEDKKFNRMKNLLLELENMGGVKQYLLNQCGFNVNVFHKMANKLVINNAKVENGADDKVDDKIDRKSIQTKEDK